MKLSVIIVNYNVLHFLEHALHSVLKAAAGIEAEIFVVDNNSVDGSAAMVKEKFPSVKLIENRENTGFAFANNQAIKASCGEYVLLLNPDTVVEEDTFHKTLHFMDAHPEAGGLGVMMIDGSGKFLPESKRSLPSPSVAFYKISGISSLFPNSRIFGKYHLGYLDKNKIHEVEVLSGAFMLLRKKVLDKTGLLDEDFFMYGEDIDLSYRIILAGYKNYYFPGTRIIHYKGESTKKSSINYVLVFYRAMVIFARKHFSKKNVRIFSFLINIAIYLRASAAILSRIATKSILPACDTLLIFGGMYFLKQYWENAVKHAAEPYYPAEYISVTVPCYIAVWLLSVFFSGGYDKPIRITKIIRGIFIGTVIILVIYALLSERYRFSRALILLGALWAGVSMVIMRLLLNLTGSREFLLESNRKKKVIIAGTAGEAQRVLDVLRQSETKANVIGFVNTNHIQDPKESRFLGNINQLSEIIGIYQADEVIFCAKDIPAHRIIDLMSRVEQNPEYKIAPPESMTVIGSSSVNNPGDLYTIDINSITRPVNKRNKRVLDILLALLFIPAWPVMFFLIKNPFHFIKNIFSVLAGFKTWVSYAGDKQDHLPAVKQGVLSPSDTAGKHILDENTLRHLNILYAKDYRVSNDLTIILRGYKNLGR